MDPSQNPHVFHATTIVSVRRNGQVEIVSGVQAGDVVVTAGQLKLRPGTPVQPVSAQP